jgi:hypothetical protein
VQFAGRKSFAVLRIASDVADGETVTIGDDIYEFDTAADPGEITAGHIRVKVIDAQTPAAATPALVAAINASGTEAVTAVKVGDNEMLITFKAVGAYTLALAEDMAGENNAWDTAALRGGAVAGIKKVYHSMRVPNAAEVALGNMHFPLDFVPTYFAAVVIVTATGVPTAWNGAIKKTDWGVQIDNSGTTDWAATDTVCLVAYE